MNELAPDRTYTLQRGDDETLVVNFTNYTPAQGDTVTFTVRDRLDAPIRIQKVVDAPQRITPASGDPYWQYVIAIDAEDTTAMAPGVYVYDLQITWGGSGKVTTIIPPSRLLLQGEVT